jgi:hypothetical protein
VTISVERLAEEMRPENTILLFGAGASIPSGAPSTAQIITHLAKRFGISNTSFSLSETASLIERKANRKDLIAELRSLFAKLSPTRGLLNLPLFDWKSLYTTNYDTLIEQSYQRYGRELVVYSSNFDFTTHEKHGATKLFKLHGTIEKDVSDGSNSRIILSQSDYDQTEDYRDNLWNRFKYEIGVAHLVIIGQSLADRDIKDIIDRVQRTKTQAQVGVQTSLLCYETDEERADLLDARGFRVCFGGVDDLFSALTWRRPAEVLPPVSDSPLDSAPELRPITIDVAHERDPERADVSAMFNGWPAKYADIALRATFERSVVGEIVPPLSSEETTVCTVILGASGVGKTTAARQALCRLADEGAFGWEHDSEYDLLPESWVKIARILKDSGNRGVLLVDEAHVHLQELNDLIDRLVAENNRHLKLILCSSRNHWFPRVKSPNIFKRGKTFSMSTLDNREIDRLLQLVENFPAIKALVEPGFSGFS